MREAPVKVRARLAFGQADGFVVWVNSTGVATEADRTFRYGLCVGSSDLIGMAPGGLFFAAEVKGDRGRPTDEQLRFLQLVHDRGGVACLVGPDSNCEEMIRGIRNGIRRHGW